MWTLLLSQRQQKKIVGKHLRAVDKRDMFDHAVSMLDLEAVLEREIGQLSGGEL